MARAGAAAGCHEALFTLGEAPEERYPAARAWLDEHGYSSTVDYLVAMCALVRDETGLLPHANAGALGADELARLRPVSASQGMMLESLDPDLACHRGAPDKTPAATPRHLGRGRARWPSPSPPVCSSGSASRAPSGSAPWPPSPTPTALHGHVQEVIVQNFLPKPGTAMHDHPPCPPEELWWTIAVARLVLPAEVHVQAPPNLSDDLRPLLDSGLDDWGGVSPVTVDHVNPERAWPAVDLLRAATEAAGLTLAARLTIYPEYALDPERWLDPAMRFPVLDRADAEGLGREDPWCSGGVEPPPALVGVPGAIGRRRSGRSGATGSAGRRRRRRGRGARRRGPRPGGRRGRDRHAVLGAGPRSASRGRGRRPVATRRGRRRRHLGGQPQHQLHQRVHLQVPVLRLLQGPAVAQPPGCSLSAGAERHHRAGGRGRGRRRHRGVPAGRHPPQLRRRLLPRGDPGRARRRRTASTSTGSPPSR